MITIYLPVRDIPTAERVMLALSALGMPHLAFTLERAHRGRGPDRKPRTRRTQAQIRAAQAAEARPS
jgi:hypothetical protein